MRLKALIFRQIARALRRSADRLDSANVRSRDDPVSLRQLMGLAGASRLDRRSYERGEVRMRYSATDALWSDVERDEHVVDLREHVRRLCLSVRSATTSPTAADLQGAFHNLRLAHSLTDVFAQIDLDDSAMLCGPAADYDSADTELIEKHLAAVSVFTFVWTAYEQVVDALVPGTAGKGARSRELASACQGGHVPHLREKLFAAFRLDPGGTEFGHVEMRRMLRLGSLVGVAAEHLRQFRNRLAHGDLPKPEPKDWGDGSKYVVDEDPHLRRFHANTRLLLLLLQTLLVRASGDGLAMADELIENLPMELVMRTLHCQPASSQSGEPYLDLGIADLNSLTGWGLWAI